MAHTSTYTQSADDYDDDLTNTKFGRQTFRFKIPQAFLVSNILNHSKRFDFQLNGIE